MINSVIYDCVGVSIALTPAAITIKPVTGDVNNINYLFTMASVNLVGYIRHQVNNPILNYWVRTSPKL